MKEKNHILQVKVLVDISDGRDRDIASGVLRYAQEFGSWNVRFLSTLSQSAGSGQDGGAADGVIANVANSGLAEELTASGLPVVNVSENPPVGFSSPGVRVDDHAAARMAVEYFMELGIHNFALAAPEKFFSQALCVEEFRAVLADSGMSYSFFAMDQADPGFIGDLTHWLASIPKPVGVLAHSAAGGAQIVNCCMQSGISVPHDVAVLSRRYDELLCNTCSPPLSGIDSPSEQIGYLAAKHLHQMMDGSRVPHETTFLPPLGIAEKLSTETMAVRDPQLVQVVQFLKTHAFTPITVEDVLRNVPLSRRTLERRFQKVFGRTLRDEICRLRINQARKLLVETDWQMTDIAEACGYSSYNYLSHAFKKATGMSPSAYRGQYCSFAPAGA